MEHWAGGMVGVFLLLAVLLDAFEVIVLPRRVSRRFQPTRYFYRASWPVWRRVARIVPAGIARETFLSSFGPLSIFALLGLWAFGLIVGFALLHWGIGWPLRNGDQSPNSSFEAFLYVSGTSFFTLGFADIQPAARASKVLAIVEGGTGFAFLAVIFAYLPVLYQSFSRREVNIALLDARAGSPSTAAELLRRHGPSRMDDLDELLKEWERWASELLESHISYPVLGYFRSQHSNQSWLAALTTILDTTALVITGLQDKCGWQARLTFAMARHAVVDLAQVFGTPPHDPHPERLSDQEYQRVRAVLEKAGVTLDGSPAALERLAKFRRLYEPYVHALAERFVLTLPPWIHASEPKFNWKSSAWEHPSRMITDE